MKRSMFVKPSRYTAKHLAQLLAAIMEVSTGSDPDAVVIPLAVFKDDSFSLNDDCEMRTVSMQCEQSCWKGIDAPPITKQVELMTGSMLLYICCDCGGYLYIDCPDPRMVRDTEYAEKRELAATYNLVGPALNKKLHKQVDGKRETSRRAMTTMRAKKKAANATTTAQTETV